MSAATFEELQEEIRAFAAARARQNKNSQSEVLKLLTDAGCASLTELKERNDAALYETLIEKLRELAGQPPRLVPVYSSILRFIQAQQDGQCSATDRDATYKAIAATHDLERTEIEHLLKEFKRKLPGEPAISVIRKELEAASRRAVHKQPLPKGAELVLFRHHESDTLYAGIYDSSADRFLANFGLAPIKGRDSIANLCAQAGQAPVSPAAVLGGVFEFRPGATPQVIKTDSGYTVNTWTPAEIRRSAVASDTVPPTVRKLLMHVLGNDKAVYEHFLNWLAVAYQTNDRTGTSWIITGCPGTGKGVLFNEVIKPLFGIRYCFGKMTKDIESRFNGWFAECLMLNVDEAKNVGFQAKQVEAALRIYCTDPEVSVEDKGIPQKMYRNYCNVIITSNEERPISVAENDRRYNVAPKQEKSLFSLGVDTEKLVDTIRAEMPQFAGYLAAYKIDTERARRPMLTEQREIMIENSATTAERMGRAIKDGDLDWFLEEYCTGVEGADVFIRADAGAEDARRVLIAWAKAANAAGSKRLSSKNVPASHVAALFNFLMPEKFGRRPQDIGRVLGLKANAYCDGGRAYRVVWQTKQSAAELKQTIHRLERHDETAETMFETTAQPELVSAASPPDPEQVFVSVDDCPADAVVRMKALFVAHGLEPAVEDNFDSDGTMTVRAHAPGPSAAKELERQIIAEFMAEEQTV